MAAKARPAAQQAPRLPAAGGKGLFSRFHLGGLPVLAAVVIAAGALLGASIKEDKDKHDERKRIRSLPADDLIGVLESRRKVMVRERDAVQRQIDAFQEEVRLKRMREEKRREKARERMEKKAAS